MANQNRVQAGVPQGGEFTTGERAENADLTTEAPAKPEPKFAVGQRVTITRAYGRSGNDQAFVVQVGRKYVYTASYPNSTSTRKFNIETGQEDLGGYSGGTIFTEQEWADRDEKNALTTRMRELGLEYRWGSGTNRKLTNDHLRRIVAILEETQG